MEERFCAHHADCGAAQLGELLGREPRDVICHMGALGVDVAPVPLLGDVCPMCGRRMPVAGKAVRNGVCDACNTRLLVEMRAVRRDERSARVDSTLETKRSASGGWGYAPFRDGDR